MSLDDAVEAGLVTAQFDDVTDKEPTYETQTYAIGFVVDQVNNFTLINNENKPSTDRFP